MYVCVLLLENQTFKKFHILTLEHQNMSHSIKGFWDGYRIEIPNKPAIKLEDCSGLSEGIPLHSYMFLK